jgi:glycosyltransferase involved in cell wall biosynthesis
MAPTEPLRILFWTREDFPTFRVDVDVLFGRELIGRGHAIDFVMQAGSAQISPGCHAWRGRRVFVGRFVNGGLIRRVFRHLSTFLHDLKCLRLARREQYDAVQFRDKFLIAAIGVMVARARGLKFFYWLSFPFPEDDRLRAKLPETSLRFLVDLRGRISAWLLYRWILPQSDHAFVQSERMKQDVAAHGVELAKMTPVPMGIDLEDFSVADHRPAVTQGQDMVLGYLGALNSDRHIEMLVDMLADLRSDRISVRLLLIGDAFNSLDKEALLRRAQEHGVSQYLHISGSLPRLDALKRMQEAHIALSPYFPTPTLMSTSPTKLVEYLALRLPVVASQHPEQRAILRASGSGVCAPWGSRHFARSVRWLLRQTPERRAEMGMKGWMWVQANRTYSHIADALECKYRELLSNMTLRKQTAPAPRTG